MRPVDPGFGISNGGIGVGEWEKIEGLSLIGKVPIRITMIHVHLHAMKNMVTLSIN